MNTETYGEYSNEVQHVDWGFAYSSTPPNAVDSYVIDDVEGVIPSDLAGVTFYKTGPGNFQRNGRQFQHVLDGDGFVIAIKFLEDGSGAKYTGRFVETEYFLEEQSEDKIKYRNVFGTQRDGGVFANAFDLTLKNVANTNVLQWGERLFVYWEAGRPYELNPDTLETLRSVKEDGPLKGLGGIGCKVRGITIDNNGPIDNIINVGKSFTAHPHVEDDDTLIGFKIETNAQTNFLTLEFTEYDSKWNEKKCTTFSVKDSLPPHDFSVSKSFYSFFDNPYSEMDNLRYLIGLKAPTQIMQLALRQPTKVHVVPRSKGQEPLTVELDHSYFCIHLNGLSEEKDGKLYLYSTGWDLTDERFFPQTQDSAPFLGAWGGPYPDFTRGKVPPSLLYETIIDVEKGTVVSHEEVRPGIVIEFPTQEEDKPNMMYLAIAAEEYTSLPSTGLCRINTETREMETWWADNKQFTHEVIPVKKQNGQPGSWLVTPLYDAGKRRTTIAIIDSEDFSSGPVCRLNLKHHVTYGLHGSFARQQLPVSYSLPAL
jgi:all-trans-8'-apo-beta-carotenal 15,15'-oxygenase